ncbi:hypothetical protein D7V97_07690 [Corallococcus sp. CA053C]|nr:hypothetical protein D7V97_07690 [Corallococcus sp. CA053C]
MDEVLFDSGGVRVTTRSVVMHGRTWRLEHVRGVTVLFQPPANRLLRALAMLAGTLLLVDGIKQGPLASFVREGSPGDVLLGVAALLGYAVLSWRALHSERASIWLHTRFSSRRVYRGRASATARALAHALRTALQQRGTGDAQEDAASGPA